MNHWVSTVTIIIVSNNTTVRDIVHEEADNTGAKKQ